MKKLCIAALALVLSLSVFTGCGCTNRRDPAMKPTDMTTVPTTAATTAPTTVPTTTPTEEITMPTMDMNEATGEMSTDPTDTMDNSAPSEATDATGNERSGGRPRNMR